MAGRGVKAIPALFLVGKNGQIVRQWTGRFEGAGVSSPRPLRYTRLVWYNLHMNIPSYIAQERDVPACLDADVCDVPSVDENLVAALRPGNLGLNDAGHLAEIFAALSDPTRLRLLDALSRADEMCVCDLCALLNLRQSNVSHQLRLLRALRLVKNRRAGRLVFYALDDDHVRRLLCEGLDHVREGRR